MMKRFLLLFVTLVTLLTMPKLYFGQINLGAAANFVLYTTGGAVNDNASSHSLLTGDVGYYSSGSFLGFGNVNGVMRAGVDPQTTAAELALQSVVTQINATTNDYFPGLLLGNGVVYTPGVYAIPGNANMSLDMILDAQNVPSSEFIIKINGTLSTAAATKVKLINGAQACNVYWLVEGQIAIATNSTMRGTFIANNAAITMATGDSLEGRLLSTTGAITIDGITAYTPQGCGSPLLTGPDFPPLGELACFSIYSSNGALTNSIGTTAAIGDVGNNGIGAISGWSPADVTGTLHLIQDATTIQANLDLIKLYDTLNAMVPDIELLYPAQFGNNLVLTPHVYVMNSAAVFTDSLTLDAQGNPDGVFVIKITGGSPALTTSTYSKVKLINGAQAKNVFWLVNGVVNINNYSIFNGNIVVPNGAINLINTGVVVNGRALTMVGAITTSGLAITMPPGCLGCITTFTNDTIEICEGDSVEVNGNFLDSTGIYNDTLTSFEGCDSIIITDLTVNQSYEFIDTVEICAGDTLIWRTNEYSTSNIFYDSLLTVKNCDSVYVLDLTVNPNFLINNPQEICDGDSIEVNGNFYDSTGIYNDTLATIDGCDSIIVTDLTVNPVYTINNPQIICDGDSIEVNGNFYDSTAIYNDTLASIDGCDSIIITDLTVNQSYEFIDTVEICAGDTLIWRTNAYSTTNIFYDSLLTVNNCDSVYALNLTVNPAVTTNISQEICDGDSIEINGNFYDSTGIYNDTLASIDGCDSIVITDLTVNPSFTINNDQAICDGDSVVVNGNSYKIAGIYTDTLATISGCDSIIITDLTIDSAINIVSQPSNQVVCEGDSVSFTVVATGANLTYQWRKGLIPLINGGNISGADSSILTINPANISDTASNYNVVISGGCNPVDTSSSTNLTSSGDFAILAGSSISSSGFSVINGMDVGLSPGVRTSISGFPPATVVNGAIYASDDIAPPGVAAMLTQAKQDLTNAYLAAEGATAPAPATIAGDQGGSTLAPGIYKSTSTLLIQAGDLTLDAQGDVNAKWIFQIASDFTTIGGAGGNVILSGGAQADNIIWQVGSSATIGSYTSFAGNILALTSITMNTGSSIDGRLLARNGSVVLSGTNIINSPSDSVDLSLSQEVSMYVSLMVNPNPEVNSAATDIVCSGSAQNYTITSNVIGTTYEWSRDSVAGISNASVSNQTNNPIVEVLNNTTLAAVNATYLIIPTANTCTGDTFTYTVTVNPVFSTNNPQTICSGGSYTFNGNTYTVSGNYNDTLSSIDGCDSIITTQLTVNPAFSTNNPQTICSGGSYIFNGNTYTTTGNYNDTLISIDGCDSIITTQLTVNPAFTANNPQIICSGESYLINGNTYTTTGIYTDTLTSVDGCDSIIITQLTINPAFTANNPQTICSGGSYTFNGNTYTVAGNYNDTLSSINGCDSIIITQLTVNPAFTANNPQTICSGDSYLINGNVYTTTGIYTDTLASITGCDSIIITQLTVNPAFSTNNPQTICSGGSYTFNGNTYTVAGNYNDTLSSITGCDSIITTQLIVNPAFSTNNPQTICSGGSYIFNGNTYTVSGNYNDTLSSIDGCDSIITTQLTVNPVYLTNNPQTICDGDSYFINGNTYTVAGIYTDTLYSISGCDSIVLTQITINPLPIALASSNSPVCAGDSINFSAQTVIGANYQWTGPNSFTSGIQNPSIITSTMADAGNYTLIVELNGCASLPSITAVVVNSCGADLSIVKTADNLYPFVGTTVEFTIVATNNGPSNSSGVIVSDILQSGFSYVSSTATAGTYNSTTADWTIGNMLADSSEVLTIIATVLESGSYINTAEISANEADPDMNNNLSSIELSPKNFFIPDGFSPNGDGINDFFVILGIEYYPENNIVIYNRWGNRVFEASPYENTWDGTSTFGVLNDKLPIGTYYYLLDLGNNNVLKGTIYLNR